VVTWLSKLLQRELCALVFDTSEPPCLGFQTFLISFLNTAVSSWPVDFPYSTAVAQVTLSSVEVCLALNYFDCFCALWNETLHQPFNVFYDSKMCLYLLKVTFHSSYAFGCCCIFLLLVFLSSLKG
jgi:hypothetical protein